MSNVPEIIVGLWILPVAVNILLPLVMLGFWLIGWLPLSLMSRSRVRKTARQKVNEKRTDRRIHADELRVDVSDGVDFFTGLACNISRLGICIMGLPHKLLPQSERLTVTVGNQGESYSLQVQPRWEEDVESGKRIGASIEYAPTGWPDFVKARGSFAPA